MPAVIPITQDAQDLDWTSVGAKRIVPVGGNLVRVPIPPGVLIAPGGATTQNTFLGAAGTPTSSVGAVTGSGLGSPGGLEDFVSFTAALGSATAGGAWGSAGSTGGAEFRQFVRGSQFGVAWFDYAIGASHPPTNFYVQIDGIGYSIPFAQLDAITGLAVDSPQPFLAWVCPDRFPDGIHEMRVGISGDFSGNSLILNLYCLLLEERAGYSAPAMTHTHVWPAVTLTTGNVGIAPGESYDALLSQIRLWNSSVGTVNVTLNVAGVDTESYALAANAVKVLDFPDGLMVTPSQFKLRCDTGAAVVSTCIGGMG